MIGEQLIAGQGMLHQHMVLAVQRGCRLRSAGSSASCTRRWMGGAHCKPLAWLDWSTIPLGAQCNLEQDCGSC
eukprot:10944156-Prorocentrum_lima.AAC.1